VIKMVFKEIREILNQVKFAGEVVQLQALVVLMESPQFEEIEDKVKKSLNTPGEIEKLVNSKDWMERLALADLLEITPDMPEELVKEAKKAAEKLSHDPMWAVKFVLAARSNIEPNFFKEIAEKLKKDKDWRVVMGLVFNENTPDEITSWIEEHKKKVLEELEELAYLQSLLQSLLRE